MTRIHQRARVRACLRRTAKRRGRQAWASLFLEHGGMDGGIRESRDAGHQGRAGFCCMRPSPGKFIGHRVLGPAWQRIGALGRCMRLESGRPIKHCDAPCGLPDTASLLQAGASCRGIVTTPKAHPTAQATLSTGEATQLLGMKRQQFQVLVRFFGLRPTAQRRLGSSRTAVNLYDVAAIELMARIGRRCRYEGVGRVLKSLAAEAEPR